MMKLTYFKTHWTADQALAVKEFLEDLAAAIEASYDSEIEDWFEGMRRECLKHDTFLRRIFSYSTSINATEYESR